MYGHFFVSLQKYFATKITVEKVQATTDRQNDPVGEIKYYRHEMDLDQFVGPYFANPMNKFRYFKSEFTGHVPIFKGKSDDNITIY